VTYDIPKSSQANLFEFKGTDPHTIMTGESRYARLGNRVLLDVNEKAEATRYGEKMLKMDYQLSIMQRI
jgi:hypothetical protein